MDRFNYLKTFYDLSQADYQLFAENYKLKTFKKGELIIVPGQVQRELYWVKSGVQMSYFDSHDKIHVSAFTYFPGFCVLPDSFLFQTPSKYFLTCLTDSELEYITYHELQRLFDQSQSIERLFRKATEAILIGVIDRHTELHSMTIEERFKTFCRRSPHLLQPVPHKYIASYLGINPTNFSKLFNSIKF